jgi:predicted nucleotidyltransferase
MVADLPARLRAFFAERDRSLDAVYLFGSVARGTARDDSDVDVAILPRVSHAGTLDSLHLDLEGELERAADPSRVEGDVRERRFVEHTLQIAIQAALDG